MTADTPPADVAGLVERLNRHIADLSLPNPPFALLAEVRDALTRLEAECQRKDRQLASHAETLREWEAWRETAYEGDEFRRLEARSQSAEADLAAERKRVAELETALRPFGKAWRLGTARWRDQDDDFRRAAALTGADDGR